MKKLTITLVTIISAIAYQACENRDQNGNTDTNNTKTSKKYTDSTRGVLGDSTVTDTLNNNR